jgi:hypothetical protein
MSTELSTDEDTTRAGSTTEAKPPRVVTRVTVQRNVQKYVPGNAAQFKMNVCKTGHDSLTQNRVTYCSPKHDYNRKQKKYAFQSYCL